MEIPRKIDLIAASFMLAMYTGVFLVVAQVGEPLTLAAFGVVLVVLAAGSVAIHVTRQKYERAIITFLETYSPDAGGDTPLR